MLRHNVLCRNREWRGGNGIAGENRLPWWTIAARSAADGFAVRLDRGGLRRFPERVGTFTEGLFSYVYMWIVSGQEPVRMRRKNSLNGEDTASCGVCLTGRGALARSGRATRHVERRNALSRREIGGRTVCCTSYSGIGPHAACFLLWERPDAGPSPR